MSKLWPLLTAGILAAALASLVAPRLSAAPALSANAHVYPGGNRQARTGAAKTGAATRHNFLFHPRIPQSLGIHIGTTDPLPGDMRMLAAAGFHWARINFLWNQTELTKGRYDFHPYDRLLAALHRNHIRPMWILGYNNPLYEHDLAPNTPQVRWAFCRWVAAAVRHFRGDGVIWEMWNEPNGSFNVRAYIKLARAVGKTIRRIAPQAILVGPALADSNVGARKFLRRCFQAGLLKYWDAVTIHPYRLSGPETVVPVYRHVRALIARYAPPGRNIPLLAGEWGYASSGWTHYNDIRQARMLAREFLVNFWQGIPLTIWFDWHIQGYHYSLVHSTYHAGRHPVYDPKPAYLAARTLATQLAGCRFVKRMKIGGADNYVLLFHGPKGKRIAAWTTSRQAHAVVLPLASGRYHLTNETGTKMRTILARANKLHLSLTHDPQYIRKR